MAKKKPPRIGDIVMSEDYGDCSKINYYLILQIYHSKKRKSGLRNNIYTLKNIKTNHIDFHDIWHWRKTDMELIIGWDQDTTNQFFIDFQHIIKNNEMYNSIIKKRISYHKSRKESHLAPPAPLLTIFGASSWVRKFARHISLELMEKLFL